MTLISCGGDFAPKPAPGQASRNLSLYPSFGGMRVKELFIVVFEKDFSEDEWKAIFDANDELSVNKRKLREIEGLGDDRAQVLRSELISKNAGLLLNLSEKSLFMLSWSAGDENCSISLDVKSLNCRPFNFDNPLNGGLPKSMQALEWVTPDPIKDEVKSPYLKVRLGLQSGLRAGNYALTLRLKPERVGEREKWLKGDAIPDPGSRFLKPDGTLAESFFPFGYAELTLEK